MSIGRASSAFNSPGLLNKSGGATGNMVKESKTTLSSILQV
jgi:hypothetical protein